MLIYRVEHKSHSQFTVVCKLPWKPEKAYPVSHTWVRVNAYSAGWAPRLGTGSFDNFTMGQLVTGFVEETSSGRFRLK